MLGFLKRIFGKTDSTEAKVNAELEGIVDDVAEARRRIRQRLGLDEAAERLDDAHVPALPAPAAARNTRRKAN